MSDEHCVLTVILLKRERAKRKTNKLKLSKYLLIKKTSFVRI